MVKKLVGGGFWIATWLFVVMVPLSLVGIINVVRLALEHIRFV